MSDSNLWWNRLKDMPEEEMQLMPMSYIKKFGSFLIKIDDEHKTQHL